MSLAIFTSLCPLRNPEKKVRNRPTEIAVKFFCSMFNLLSEIKL